MLIFLRKFLQPLSSIFCALLLVSFVSACETFEPQQSLDVEDDAGEMRTGTEASLSPFNWSPPNYAGLTAGRIIYPNPVEGQPPIVAEFLSGKEAETANVTFATPEGNIVSYQVGGLRAFEGQLARADVEKNLAESLAGMWETLGPEIRGGIVDAICAGLTGGACAAIGGL